jgi:hypothetical protein
MAADAVGDARIEVETVEAAGRKLRQAAGRDLLIARAIPAQRDGRDSVEKRETRPRLEAHHEIVRTLLGRIFDVHTRARAVRDLRSLREKAKSRRRVRHRSNPQRHCEEERAHGQNPKLIFAA